jgi:hypothetical protein
MSRLFSINMIYNPSAPSLILQQDDSLVQHCSTRAGFDAMQKGLSDRRTVVDCIRFHLKMYHVHVYRVCLTAILRPAQPLVAS